MPPAWSSTESVVSSAALRARRLNSWTVKMTGVSGAASLNCRRCATHRGGSGDRTAGEGADEKNATPGELASSGN